MEGRSLEVHRSLLEVDGRSFEVEGRWLEVDGRSFKLDGRSFEVEGRSLEVDGRSLEVDGRSLKVDRRLLEVDGRPLEVDGRSFEVEGRPRSLEMIGGKGLAAPQYSRAGPIAHETSCNSLGAATPALLRIECREAAAILAGGIENNSWSIGEKLWNLLGGAT